MAGCPYPMADLLPHEPPMVLLDRVTAWDELGLSACVTIGPETRFAEPGAGVPAHVGIEWMAQACGALVGLRATTAGQPVRPGFLLSTRDFAADRAWFVTGELLVVFVHQVFHQGGMAVFDCRIDSNGTTCTRARLTLFQSPDAIVEKP
jgi:predicted hotdog family 3-hydroxylacyl-ACP dehydratase